MGPTGSGKTQLLMELDSSRFEAVCFDSRQVYRFLETGTTQPTEAEQKKIQHFCISYLDPDKRPNAKDHSERSKNAIEEIFAKGKIPILVVGTGFYLRAFLNGMFAVPEISEETKQYVESLPESEFREELKKYDPSAEQKIPDNDSYRLKRALEVCLSGSKWSDVENTLVGGFLQESEQPLASICIDWDRQELYHRINLRAESLIHSQKMLEEAKFVESRFGKDCPGLQTLGMNFTLDFASGKIKKEEFYSLLSQSHRNYAKKQLTWFRKEKNVKFLSWAKALESIKNIKI